MGGVPNSDTRRARPPRRDPEAQRFLRSCRADRNPVRGVEGHALAGDLERLTSSQRAARNRFTAAFGARALSQEISAGEPGALQLAPLQPLRAVAVESPSGAGRILGPVPGG